MGMEAYPWSVGALRDEFNTSNVLNPAVENGRPEKEGRCDASASSQSQVPQLALTNMRAIGTPDEQTYQLQHSRATSLDGVGLSLRLYNVLQGFLSKLSFDEDIVPELEVLRQPVSNSEYSNQGNDLTQEDRRAERNRKGRERSLRTRRRNSAHIKMLETACGRLVRENNILRELVNCLQRVPPAEERLISIFKMILFPAPGLSSVLQATTGHFGRHLALPPCSATSATCPNRSQNHEELSNNQAGFSTYQGKSCRSSVVRIGNEPFGAQYVSENEGKASCWKEEQAEESNVSKTSMSGMKSAVDTEMSGPETCTHSAYNPTSEILDQDSSVLVKFTLEDINTCLSMYWKDER